MTYAQVRITGSSVGTINLNDHATFSIAPGWRPSVAPTNRGVMGNRAPGDHVTESIPLVLHVNNNKTAAITALNNLVTMFEDALAWRDGMTALASVKLEISPHATGAYQVAAIVGPAAGTVAQLLELIAGFYGQLEGPAVGPINLEFVRTGLWRAGGTSILNSGDGHTAVNFTLFSDQVPAMIDVRADNFYVWSGGIPGGYLIVTGGSLVGNQRKIALWRPEHAAPSKIGTWATVADATAEGGSFMRYTPTTTDPNLNHGISGYTTDVAASPTTTGILQNGLLYGTFLVVRNRSTTINYQVWLQYEQWEEATRRYLIDTSTQEPRVIFLGTHSPFYSSQGIRVLADATGSIANSLDIDSIIMVLIDEHTHIIKLPRLYSDLPVVNPFAININHQYPFWRDPRAVISSVGGTHHVTAAGDLSVYFRVPGVTTMALFTEGPYWRPYNDSGAVTLSNNSWTITPSPVRFIPK